jgi:hypothetical protein
LRNSYVSPIRIFIFDTDQAKIISVVLYASFPTMVFLRCMEKLFPIISVHPFWHRSTVQGSLIERKPISERGGLVSPGRLPEAIRHEREISKTGM